MKTTPTRTRSMSVESKGYIESHVSMRLRQAKEGQIYSPQKVEDDAKFLIEAGNTLLEAVSIAKKTAPKTIEKAESQDDQVVQDLKNQIKSLKDRLAKKSKSA